MDTITELLKRRLAALLIPLRAHPPFHPYMVHLAALPGVWDWVQGGYKGEGVLVAGQRQRNQLASTRQLLLTLATACNRSAGLPSGAGAGAGAWESNGREREREREREQWGARQQRIHWLLDATIVLVKAGAAGVY